MSIWHHVNSEYIDVDHTTEEVNLLIGADDSGNEYVILTFLQVKEIYLQIISNVKE